MKVVKSLILIAICGAFFVSCGEAPTVNNEAGIDPAKFDKVVDGKKVKLMVLKNANGYEMTVTNYGAKVVSFLVPDKRGKKEDIVLGFDNIDGYLTAKEVYFGAAIGRYGNRIANGKFSIDSVEYTLATNNGENHLHGGVKGFNAVVWDAEQINNQKIEFDYLSKDMEEGYPGNLSVRMTYELTDKNQFKISYEAITDKSTPINLTHHSFFNLHGAGQGDINDHVLYINADFYTPTDKGLIPTGEIAPVKGTPFDFGSPTVIGERVDEEYEPLTVAGGYDHNFVLNQPKAKEMVFAASIREPKSGRFMEVYTDEPGLQFYGGNFLNSTIQGKNKKHYNYRSAFCLETQHFPDSPNKPNFPTTILNPGQIYSHTCIYKFSIKK